MRGRSLDPKFDVFRHLNAQEMSPILREVTLNATAVTVVLADDEATRAVAWDLAARLLDSPLTFEPADAVALHPLLVTGPAERVGVFLAAKGLPPVPDSLAGRGTAWRWATRHGVRPVLVEAASDKASLGALLRLLPHYGCKSYLIFDGGKALDSGSWPVGPGSLRVRLN
jgi:hypothetical protein